MVLMHNLEPFQKKKKPSRHGARSNQDVLFLADSKEFKVMRREKSCSCKSRCFLFVRFQKIIFI